MRLAPTVFLIPFGAMLPVSASGAGHNHNLMFHKESGESGKLAWGEGTTPGFFIWGIRMAKNWRYSWPAICLTAVALSFVMLAISVGILVWSYRVGGGKPFPIFLGTQAGVGLTIYVIVKLTAWYCGIGKYKSEPQPWEPWEHRVRDVYIFTATSGLPIASYWWVVSWPERAAFAVMCWIGLALTTGVAMWMYRWRKFQKEQRKRNEAEPSHPQGWYDTYRDPTDQSLS